MQGGPFEEKKFRKKNPKKNVSQCRKKIERGDSLVSPGMICYAEKQVKPFWPSSLGQMVLFDTIIFCRTFKNYFGQFVWIEKKRVTIIVAFHFMKRRLKIINTHITNFPYLKHEEEALGWSRDCTFQETKKRFSSNKDAFFGWFGTFGLMTFSQQFYSSIFKSITLFETQAGAPTRIVSVFFFKLNHHNSKSMMFFF